MAAQKILKSALTVFRPAMNAPFILQTELYFLPDDCADIESVRKVGMNLYWEKKLWRHRKAILWAAYEETREGEEPRIVWHDYPLFVP